MTERGEPRLGVVLAAFLGVCGLADVSPLFKLHPPSAILGLLVGEGEGTRATVLYALLVGVAVAVPALALWLVARSRALPDGRGALFANVSIVLLLFAVAQIMATRASSLHALGRGSDQGDCIVMPARALASGHWPYDRALIWSGNACSPGLGWVALALPLVLVTGYASFLVAGGAAFAALPERMLGRRTVTAFLLLTVSCVTSWQSLATGADDLAIGIGFALVTLLSARPRLTILAAIAAGLLATARLPFAFFPLALAAFLFVDGERKRGVLFGAVALGTLGLAHGVPLAIDACSYLDDGPLHVLGKAVRLERRGGAAIFVAFGAAWVAYAAWSLRRPRGPLARQFDVGTLTLLCVAGPALANLIGRARAAPSEWAAEGVQGWQGGNWLLAALPCYALVLAMACRADAGTTPAMPLTR